MLSVLARVESKMHVHTRLLVGTCRYYCCIIDVSTQTFQECTLDYGDGEKGDFGISYNWVTASLTERFSLCLQIYRYIHVSSPFFPFRKDTPRKIKKRNCRTIQKEQVLDFAPQIDTYVSNGRP